MNNYPIQSLLFILTLIGLVYIVFQIIWMCIMTRKLKLATRLLAYVPYKYKLESISDLGSEIKIKLMNREYIEYVTFKIYLHGYETIYSTHNSISDESDYSTNIREVIKKLTQHMKEISMDRYKSVKFNISKLSMKDESILKKYTHCVAYSMDKDKLILKLKYEFFTSLEDALQFNALNKKNQSVTFSEIRYPIFDSQGRDYDFSGLLNRGQSDEVNR